MGRIEGWGFGVGIYMDGGDRRDVWLVGATLVVACLAVARRGCPNNKNVGQAQGAVPT